jgi:hypothetical protein
MSKISSERAAEQLEMLAMLGEASTARDELFDGMTNDEARMTKE